MPAILENSAVATGLEKVSFLYNLKERQSQRMQTTAQLHSSHNSKVVLKILQPRLQQFMSHEFPEFKLDLEKAEEPEIKLPTSTGS